MGVSYEIQYKIPTLPRKLYDFMFINGDKVILIEFDGVQQIEFFTPTYGDFINRQQSDRVKT